MSDFGDFINVITALKNRNDLEDFLIGITTDQERKEFAQRVEIVKMLLDGIPQKQISDKLGVGIGTVTRGSKEIKSGRFVYLKEGKIRKT